MRRATLAALLAASVTAACGGTPNTPGGPYVGSPGTPQTPAPALVKAGVIVSVPHANAALRRAHYVSIRTQSVVVALASANGSGVSNGTATTLDVTPHSPGCQDEKSATVCTGTVDAVAGSDVFNVTTFAGPGGTGPVLSAGPVSASVTGSSGNVSISRLALSLEGIPASLKLALSPAATNAGKAATTTVLLTAYDAAGAAIVGPSSYEFPVALSIQGDSTNAFALHAGTSSGSSISVTSPAQRTTLSYDGNKKATSVTLQAALGGGGSASANATFTLRGTVPPPVPGYIYALNVGTSGGPGGTVTVYAANATGNAAPIRTLTLDAKLYPQSIALDAQQRLYVGYFDTAIGASIQTGNPDPANEIAIYAAGASGSATPAATLVADKSSGTTIFPAAMAFDPSGELVTYGATNIDGNSAADSVLTYAAGAQGAVAPADGFHFTSPFLHYPGVTGLAIDKAGNFYVAGTLKTFLSPQSGVFVVAAADRSNPAVTAARVLPWDDGTGLFAGEAGEIALDSSGEIYIANFTVSSSGCQAQSNVYAGGATGGTTDVPPLRTTIVSGALAAGANCANNALAAHFPGLSVFGDLQYASDDFNDAIDIFSTSSSGTVTPTQSIAGSATLLDAPIALAIAPSPQPTTSAREGHARFSSGANPR